MINARSAEELVFVRGTTEGINLVANSWGNSNVRAGDKHHHQSDGAPR
ncbi:aminotransferase class V-fold PLP-dependent enzyme [Escherichia coli]